MLSDDSFRAVSDAFHRVSGIRLTASKRQLVVGRLHKLANEKGARSLDDYVQHVVGGDDSAELVRMVDRLTTNETYFFREPAHFKFLSERLAERRPEQEFRVWSAASSSGEEAYSIAMLLADKLGMRGWKIVGTDLSTAMVEAARRAVYPMERTRETPSSYLKQFCLRGSGPFEGQLMISKELRANVTFQQANLMKPLPDLGLFDVVFLRNVLIYFENEAKQDIVRRVAQLVKPNGYLFTGHAESLSNLDTGLRPLKPAIYARA